MIHPILLILHLLAASIWVGGHLLLSIRFLPEALQKKDLSIILNFKDKFEVVGLPSILILLISGIMMAYNYGVPFSRWFSFSDGIEKIISIKLILIFTTIILAAYSQLYIFPKANSERMFPLAFQIILVTLIGVGMLVLGSLIQLGGV